MKVVDFIFRDHRSPKHGVSYVHEAAMLRRACGPIFPLHDAVIRGGGAECDAIPLVVGAHARETVATDNPPLEVKDMGWLAVRTGSLVVTAEFVEPRYGVWFGAPIEVVLIETCRTGAAGEAMWQ